MGKNLLLITADCESARQRLRDSSSPRLDYLELADVLDADVLDTRSVQASKTARRLGRVHRGAGHAWLASQVLVNYDNVFTDGEHLGLFLGIHLAGKQHRCRHVMIGHGLSSWRKRALFGWAKKGIDALVVHCGSQLKFVLEKLRMDPGQVYLMPYQVDTEFWQPQPGREELLIVSCGLEQRDYATLAQAVRDLPVGVSIAAASNWSRYRNRVKGKHLPPNVAVSSHDYAELRDLYAQARIVVVPLVEGDYPAGIATVLEAMAMGKPVIVTKTRGQETVVGPLWQGGQSAWPTEEPFPEDSTGIYVAPGDTEGLRSAIVYLLERPELGNTLGCNARRFVAEHRTIESFAARLAPVIDPAYALADPDPVEVRARRSP